MYEVVGTLVGVTLGAVMGFGGSFILEERRSRRSAADERQRLLARFFGQLAIVVAEVSRWPAEAPPGFVERGRGWLISRSRQLTAREFARTQEGMRQVFGERPYVRLEELLLTYAELKLTPLEPPVRDALDEALAYAQELAASRSDELKERWWQVRDDLLSAFVGHGYSDVRGLSSTG